MDIIQFKKEEIKNLLTILFDSIKLLGHYSYDVDDFYQETIKELDKVELEEGFKKFYQKIENKTLAFLEQDICPGKICSVNCILKAIPISNEGVNKIIERVLIIFKIELMKIAKNAYYAIAIPNLNLRLSCLSILTTIAFYNKRFENYQLTKENYQQLFKIIDFIEKTENEAIIIKKGVLNIKKHLMSPSE